MNLYPKLLAAVIPFRFVEGQKRLLAVCLGVGGWLGMEEAGWAEFVRTESEVRVLVWEESNGLMQARVLPVVAKVHPGRPGRATRIGPAAADRALSRAADLARRASESTWGRTWPAGYEITLGWSGMEDWTPSDEASLAAGWALALGGLVTGESWDGDVALLGRVDEDGTLRRAGGVDLKLRAALSQGVKRVAIAEDSWDDLLDVLVAGGALGLCQVQVFSFTRLAEVVPLAAMGQGGEWDGNPAAALFQDTVGHLEAPVTATRLNGPELRQSLKRIMGLAPNHASARLLFLSGSGRTPAHLSLKGSLQQALPVVDQLKEAGDYEEFYEILVQMRRTRSKLHPAVRALADAILGCAEAEVGLHFSVREKKEAEVQKWETERERRRRDFEDRHVRLRHLPEVESILSGLAAEDW